MLSVVDAAQTLSGEYQQFPELSLIKFINW